MQEKVFPPHVLHYTTSYAESPRRWFVMLPTDLNGLRSLQPRRNGLRGTLRPAGLAGSFLLLSGFATICSPVSRAQDQNQNVAEAARQERARKQEPQKKAKHVYTDQDLKRARILTPEDQAVVEAKKNECAQKNNCVPPQTAPATLDANAPRQQPPADADSKQQPSLGEVARQYRRQKELQAQKQKELDALKPQQSEPFHLSIGTPALASPVLPARPAAKLAAPPVIRSATPSAPGFDSHVNVFRRDPFSRVPTRPRVPLGAAPEVRPAVPSSPHALTPSAPRIPSPPAPASGLLGQPTQPAKPFVAPNSKHSISSEVSTRPARPTSHRGEEQLVAPAISAPTAQPFVPLAKPRDFGFAPVRPVLPRKTRRAASLPALASFFPPAKPIAPIEAPSAIVVAPTAPIEARSASAVAPFAFSSARPTAPSKRMQPGPAPNLLPRLPSTPVAPLPWSLGSPRPPASASATVTVRVEPGDSLWKVAQRNLGRGNLWPAILAANPAICDANRLHIGAQLAIPARTTATAGWPARVGRGQGQTIIVSHGDTLWSLAKSSLGRSSYWTCLAAANPSLADPNRILPGQKLVLPSSCSAARTESNLQGR